MKEQEEVKSIVPVVIAHKQIAERAYHIWERQGRSHGRDVDHWLQAQDELMTEAVLEQFARGTKSTKPMRCAPVDDLGTSCPTIAMVSDSLATELEAEHEKLRAARLAAASPR
jgi:hypothetical protein